MTKLDEFGFLSITGKDALTFTQGYTTCDIDSLAPDQTAMGAICNLQGRMVTSFRAALLEDGLILRMDKALVEPTREFLKKYILLSKAESRDDSDSWQCFGIVGDGWGELPDTIGGLVTRDDCYIVRVSDKGPRFEVWAQSPLAEFEQLESMEPAQWHRQEVADGLAWVNSETADAFIPQMFNYDQLGGISFEKGCYLGQEIVARMQHRGQVKRRLYRGKSSAAVKPGDQVVNGDGKNIGTVVSSAGESKGCGFLAVIQTRAADEAAMTEDGQAVNLEPAFNHE